MTDQDINTQQLEQANANPLIPHIYANGFNNASGPMDVTTALIRNGVPVATVNMSYGAAKSLAYALLSVIENFETMTGSKIMAYHEIEQAATKQRTQN